MPVQKKSILKRTNVDSSVEYALQTFNTWTSVEANAYDFPTTPVDAAAYAANTHATNGNNAGIVYEAIQTFKYIP